MDIERWSAFTDSPDGGNPAGVVVVGPGDPPDDAAMQRIAAEVGYSETAFLFPADEHTYDVRYFAPEVEVPFCGHATIASGAALLDRDPGSSTVVLRTVTVGEVPVRLETDAAGLPMAELRSPPTAGRPLADDDLDALLGLFGWTRADLDPDLPIEVAHAGADHPVLGLRSRELLAAMSYPFDELRALMTDRGWTTLQIVHRLDDATFAARDPFPVGGVVEDPATGAAAAAFGGLLRRHGLLPSTGRVVVLQGQDMGRPSRIEVDARGGDGDPVAVAGTAVRIGSA